MYKIQEPAWEAYLAIQGPAWKAYEAIEKPTFEAYLNWKSTQNYSKLTKEELIAELEKRDNE